PDGSADAGGLPQILEVSVTDRARRRRGLWPAGCLLFAGRAGMGDAAGGERRCRPSWFSSWWFAWARAARPRSVGWMGAAGWVAAAARGAMAPVRRCRRSTAH